MRIKMALRTARKDDSMTQEIFGGAMSGTSLDGVDVVLAGFDAAQVGAYAVLPSVLAHGYRPYPPELRDAVLAVCHGQPLTLPELGRLDLAIARVYVQAIRAAVAQVPQVEGTVKAVGVHGQTVFHQPLGDARFTMQIGDPNHIAVHTGIPVVADFRRRDMALGGQGAPLAPGFHAQCFRHAEITRIVCNCGGIANITVLQPGADTYGYDTGPANVLMDAWCALKTGQPFDRDGQWARGGQLIEPLLQTLLQEPYLGLPHPKSTGRELFHLDWLQPQISRCGVRALADRDVMRTLLEFTARTIADESAKASPHGGEMYVCGGGAMNAFLMERLVLAMPGWRVQSTAALGMAPDQVEALAFASFARSTVRGLPANVPSVTGASRACILGAVYAV